MGEAGRGSGGRDREKRSAVRRMARMIRESRGRHAGSLNARFTLRPFHAARGRATLRGCPPLPASRHRHEARIPHRPVAARQRVPGDGRLPPVAGPSGRADQQRHAGVQRRRIPAGPAARRRLAAARDGPAGRRAAAGGRGDVASVLEVVRRRAVRAAAALHEERRAGRRAGAAGLAGDRQAALSMRAAPREPVLRAPGAQRSRVSEVELFYDLVFVFAVTQLSHGLLEQLTLHGALRTGLLFLGVWWMWMFTAWTTNWLNPASTPVRQLLFALMLLGLAMSSALPRAFGDKGLLFAVAYVAQHLLRTLYVIHAFGRATPRGMNFVRILTWQLAAGACWIAGGLADPQARMLWWAAAIGIEYLGPISFFRVPG